MVYLTLTQIKQHLNIDATETSENTYLEQIGEVAEQAVERHLDTDLDTIISENNGELPKPIIQAMLLLVGNFYNSRENVVFGSVQTVPYSFEYLLDFYKNYNPSKCKQDY